jgi:galactose-1-phosphate uridylyltransferase
MTSTPIVEELLDYAQETGIIEAGQTARDLFDNKIMNCVMPRPSEVIHTFNTLYEKSAKEFAKAQRKLLGVVCTLSVGFAYSLCVELLSTDQSLFCQ